MTEHFARPGYLILLFALPLLLAYLVARDAATRRRRERLADSHLFAHLSMGEPGSIRVVRRALLLAGLALLAFATARPLGSEKFESFEAKGVDIVFAIDVSESMRAEDMRPGNRLNVTKFVVGDFIRKLEFDRVGVVAFAGDCSVVCPLTLDHDTAISFLAGLDFGAVEKEGTNLGEAIQTANDRFVDEGNIAKVIVLLTDGEEQEGAAVEAARKVAKTGTRIYTVGIGDKRGVPIPIGQTVFGERVYKRYKGEPVLTQLEEGTLRDVAFATGGKYYHVTSNETLTEVLEEIRTMDRRVFRVSKKAVRSEAFQLFLIPALLLILASLLLRERRLVMNFGARRVTRLPLLLLAALLLPGYVDPAYEVRLGTDAFRARDFERAGAHYRAADLRLPDSYATRYDLGTARYKQGDYEAAARCFADAARLDGKSAGAQYNLGNARFKQDRLAEAIAAYEKAVELAPDDADARFNLEQAKRKLKMREQKERERQEKQQSQQGKDGQPKPQPGQKGQDPKDAKGNKGEKGEDPKNAKGDKGEKGDKGDKKQAGADDKKGEGQEGQENSEETRKVDEAIRQMDQSQISENRMRRYLKNLGDEDQQISERFRRQATNRKKSQRRDPFDLTPEEMMRQMQDPNYDPLEQRGPQENTDQKDW